MQYLVNSISKSIPCFYLGASSLLGMIHFKKKACHVLHTGVHYIFCTWFWYLFCTFCNVLEKLVSEVVHFIKSHVLWKFSFSVWSISGFLLCFKLLLKMAFCLFDTIKCGLFDLDCYKYGLKSNVLQYVLKTNFSTLGKVNFPSNLTNFC